MRAYNSKKKASARANSARLIANDNIQAEISRICAELTVDRKDELKYFGIITAEHMAKTELTDFASWNNKKLTVKPSNKIDARGLQELSVDEFLIKKVGKGKSRAELISRKVKIKLVDKNKSLDTLAKYLGLAQQHEHKHKGIVFHIADYEKDWV